VPQYAVDKRRPTPRRSTRPGPCRARVLAAALAALLMSATAGADELKPFEASYAWDWHGMTVAVSNLKLEKRSGDTWTYSSKSEPRGLGRLLSERPKTVSVLRVTSAQVEPLSYKGDDGTGSTKRKVDVEYDWEKHRVTGVYEDTPVDLPLTPGVQDEASVQVALMVELLRGHTPERFEHGARIQLRPRGRGDSQDPVRRGRDRHLPQPPRELTPRQPLLVRARARLHPDTRAAEARR
jgi:Protein of unknown function (DUF3108)